MRFIIFLLISAIAFSACNKDKFTEAPQISFKKFNPNQGSSTQHLPDQPYVIFEITDGDGDLDQDSAKIFIKNLLTNVIDSTLHFPDLSNVAGKNFKAEVQAGLFNIMPGPGATPGHPAPFIDTIAFEIYVVDHAKNKSNVIIASPFYYFQY